MGELVSLNVTQEHDGARIDSFVASATELSRSFAQSLADDGKIPFTLSRETKRERLLAALREAEEVANDPNAPTCTDPDKLEEFMLS